MTIQVVDERIDMKLGALIEHFDSKLAQLLEVLQVQTDHSIDIQKEQAQKLEKLRPEMIDHRLD